MLTNKKNHVICKLLPIFLLIAYGNCFLFSFTSAQGQSVANSIIAEMISKIDDSEIYNTVYHLQNFSTRRYGYSGNTEAAAYLYNKLSNISGLSVEYQGSYNNIIATLPGTDTTSNAIFMVGAHYDSTSSNPTYAPGATDNGGGVAIVLEFARIMSQYRFNHTLQFALWNAEENGGLGSSDYAKHAYDNHLNISLYFNFDSACYDPNDRLILDIMHNTESAWVSEIMTQDNALYNINLTLTYNAHACGSDHRSFWQYGYTAVMTHEETHGPAHSQYDTVDQVSTMYAKKNGQLGMSVIAQFAAVQGLIPEIRDFTPLLTILLLLITILVAVKIPKRKRD